MEITERKKRGEKWTEEKKKIENKRMNETVERTNDE